jgi:Xaa-Pro aminopeptidase
LAAAKVDAALITAPADIRWLTGFSGSSAVVWLTHDRLTLITDGRYETQAVDELGHLAAGGSGLFVDIEIIRTLAQRDDRLTSLRANAASVALGPSYGWQDLAAAQRSWAAGVRIVDLAPILAPLRAVKDQGEIAAIRRAVAIADDALAVVAPHLMERPTERDIALALDTEMRRAGADGSAYDTIVASGPNAARPHHHPTDRVVQAGDLVVIDVGAYVDGYRSDMTRTFCVGRPTARQQRLYDATVEAQRAGVEAVRSGVITSDVDLACRTELKRHRLARYFVHGTGHGVGLDIHEDPFLGSTTTGVLAARNVITVEPGVYVEGYGGVRIEDLVVVTRTGCTVLTGSAKTLDPTALSPA